VFVGEVSITNGDPRLPLKSLICDLHIRARVAIMIAFGYLWKYPLVGKQVWW